MITEIMRIKNALLNAVRYGLNVTLTPAQAETLINEINGLEADLARYERLEADSTGHC